MGCAHYTHSQPSDSRLTRSALLSTRGGVGDVTRGGAGDVNPARNAWGTGDNAYNNHPVLRTLLPKAYSILVLTASDSEQVICHHQCVSVDMHQ